MGNCNLQSNDVNSYTFWKKTSIYKVVNLIPDISFNYQMGQLIGGCDLCQKVCSRSRRSQILFDLPLLKLSSASNKSNGTLLLQEALLNFE